VIHSLEPWLIARTVPSLERTAQLSLIRAGYEAWFPSLVDLKPLPLRRISPNKRHMAKFFVQEVRRPRFAGYVFARPLPHCRWDPWAIGELHGCRGLVYLGAKTAQVPDWDVEIMRLAEARGTFDTWIGTGRKHYRITRAADTQGTKRGRPLPLLGPEEARRLHLAVDAMGRVSRLIDQANGTAFAPMAAQAKPSGIDPRGT